MADLNKRIADLEARVAKYETELDAATSVEEKQRISGLISSRTETLNRFLDEKKAQSRAAPHNLVDDAGTPVKIQHGVNLGNAVNLAAHSSCRQFIEQIKKEYVEKHSEYQNSGKCSHIFPTDASVSSVLKHFEDCTGVTSRNDVLLGDELNAELSNLKIQAPSAGNFRSLYKGLSESIHNCNWFKDDFNCVIIPNDLDIVLKRFIIRFLMAKGLQCVIATHDGGVRDPTPEEITTPDKNKKQKT